MKTIIFPYQSIIRFGTSVGFHLDFPRPDSGGVGAAGASGVGGSATAAGCGEKHQDEAGATAVENGQNGEVTGFHAIFLWDYDGNMVGIC